MTRRQQAEPESPPLEIPEFRDVEHRPDGSWQAIHKTSGEVIVASTFERLEHIEAPIVRILHTWGRPVS